MKRHIKIIALSNKFPLSAAFSTWPKIDLPVNRAVTSSTRGKIRLNRSCRSSLSALVPLVGKRLFSAAQKTDKQNIETQDSYVHYMPQLDGLRALAVGAVLIHHFFGEAKIAGADMGTLGVWCFFVLSGFLITGILLRSKDQVDYRGYQVSFLLLQFYVRRFLRIFPLYYFALSFAAMLNLGDVRDTLIWHLAYLSNYLFAMQGYFGLVTAHFWS
jgi:acyltransferase-like protein